MIILILSLILLILFITPLIYRRKQGEDLFSPLMISIFFLIVTNIPYLLTIAYNYNIINPQVRFRISYNEIDYAIVYYAFILIIGYIGLLLGLRSRFSKILIKKLPAIITLVKLSRYKIAVFICLTIGMLAYFYFIQSIGGMSYWLDNLYKRASYTSGNGYILSLLNLLNIGVFIYICTFKYKRSTFKYILLFFLILLVSIILSSLGGRKPTLQFLVFCFIIWHFCVERFKRIPLKMILLIPLAVIYIVVIPIIRSPLGIDYYMNNPESFKSDISDGISNIAKSVSYIDHYLLILDHFSINNLWLGKSYIDLLYAPIPSKLYPDKPPVDDGVYIRSIAEGMDVAPSTPYRNMYQSSWPPETIGTMYMNFWIPGVFLGMYILGCIYNSAYLYMKKSNYSLLAVMVYGYVLLNLQLSNLRIIQTLSDIIISFLILRILFFSIRNRKIL